MNDKSSYAFLSRSLNVSGFEPSDDGNTGSLCNGSTAAATAEAKVNETKVSNITIGSKMLKILSGPVTSAYFKYCFATSCSPLHLR